MKQFMNEDFLLSTDTAKTLYHDYAKIQPIFDYHCHLNPRDIAENRQFKDLTEIWLEEITINGEPCVQLACKKS